MMNSIKIDTEKTSYDVNNMLENLFKFKLQFDNLNKLQQHDKIYIHDNNIMIDEYSYTRPIIRYFYGHNRYVIYEYFQKELNDYLKLLDMVIAAERDTAVLDCSYGSIIKQYGLHNLLITGMLKGLAIINDTYKVDMPQMNNLLSTVIENLKGFQLRYTQLLETKKKNDKIIDNLYNQYGKCERYNPFTLSDSLIL